jgi:hypothetical protein
MSEHADAAAPTTVDELAADASLDLAEEIVDHLASRERSWRRLAHLCEQLAWIASWAARQERRP